MDSSRNQSTWWKVILVVAAMIFALAQAAWAAPPVKLWGPDGVLFRKPYLPGHIGISDGVGGVVIIGADPSGQNKLAIHRIDANGVFIWEEGDVYIGTPGRSYGILPDKAAADGTGGIFFVWGVAASGHHGEDIRAQHIDAQGRAIWPEGGLNVPTCIDPDCWAGSWVQVIHDGSGGAIILWTWSAETNFKSIMVQRVSPDGTLLWGPHGAEISGIAGSLESIKIAGDGEGGVIVAWKEKSSEWIPIPPYGYVTNIYVQRFNHEGQVQWPGSGVQVSGTYVEPSSYSAPFALTGDQEGGAIIAWTGRYQSAPEESPLRLQKIDSNGSLRWQPDAVVVGTDGSPELIPDGSGGAIVGWQSSSYDLYVKKINAQRVTAEGILAWGPEGVELSAQPYHLGSPVEPKIVDDLEGGAIISWILPGNSEGPYLGYSIKAQRVDGSGQIQWGPDGFEVFFKPDAYSGQYSLSWTVSDGEGGVIVSGITVEPTNPFDEYSPFFAQRLNDQFTSWATRTLKVRKTGRGIGSVTDSLGGIDCGFDCWEAYPTGTVATLVPTPAQGSGFWAWEGDPDCADGSLTMNTNKICEARFQLLVQELSVSPPSKDFNHVDLGTTSSQVFTVENSGLVELNIGSISVLGSHVDEYILSRNECAGMTLPPRQSCQLEIAFSPASRGSKTADIHIQSDDPSHPLTVISLSGLGAQQVISVIPTYLYFGLVSPGDEAEETILVRNDGENDLTITAITGPSSPFSWRGGSCQNNTVLIPGGSCDGTIAFAPSAEDLFQSTLTIYSNDPDEPTRTVTLVGRGVHQGISVLPTSLYFGYVSPGDESEETILVRNDGDGDLTITAIAGPSSPVIWRGGTCQNGTVLHSGEGCTVIIAFTPSTEDFFHAILSIYSNDLDEPTKTVFLSGVSGSPFREGPQAEWKISSLSKGGRYSSIAVDPFGHPHITYRDESNPSNYVLKHAFFDGKTWHKETVDTDVGWGSGWSSAIAVDSLGHVHISYPKVIDPNAQPTHTYALKYAYFDGTTWTITSLESGGDNSSIAVDNNNNPHIIHVNSVKQLRYVRYDGSDWVGETIPFDAYRWDYYTFGPTSLALNSFNHAHITFFASYSIYRNLYWANNISGVWEIQEIGPSDGEGSSLALDGSGNPHIVYSPGGWVNYTGGIRYSRYLGLHWETQILTKGWDAGVALQPSLALDVNDHPHISFSYHVSIGDYGLDTIIYAHFNGEHWLFDLIDYKNSGNSSIALGPGGFPHVSFKRSSGRELGDSTLLYAYHPGISLTVSKKGNGTGSVVSSPAGINCGPICKYEFQPGLQVTLTALPNPGSGFAGWVGCPDPSGNTCTLLLSDRTKVTALFSKSTLKVKKKSVNKGTGTVVSSDGKIDCGVDCSETYPTGTAVTLTAQPDTGSTFLTWSGACSGTSPECIITLGRNTSVTAKFAK